MSQTHPPLNTPSLPILDTTQPHTFIPPQKKINEGHDVPDFLVSKAYTDIMTFLHQLNRAMFPCSIENSNPEEISQIQIWELGSSENLSVPESVIELEKLLEKLNAIIDEVPPDPGPRRFGNASFRKWYEAVEDRIGDLLSSHLPPSILSSPHTSSITSTQEITSYLLGSFGSPQRLDYGSGHELSFLAFLGCIWKLGGFLLPLASPSPSPSPSEPHPNPSPLPPPGNTERAITLHLINPYLTLIRRLIKTYSLEPAGSHGVWGLDDHSFLPYILGSAQYGPAISPTSPTPTSDSLSSAPDPGAITKPPSVARERDKNLYFGAIGFIHDVKKGPFWEHSPMLYDISGVRAGWGKINKGMLKMYNAEVLSKFPVVQHFRFGSLFCWERDPHAASPTPTTHTCNQPVREGTGVSLENASARGPPPEGTKAPWANKPALGVGTAAPWAGRASTMEAGSRVPPTTRFPQATTREPIAIRTQNVPSTTEGASGGSSMPPPTTRAPWAKKPP